MFQWTKEVMEGYVRVMKSCLSNVEEVIHLVLPLFLLGPLHMIVSLTINAAQFDSVHKSVDQN